MIPDNCRYTNEHEWVRPDGPDHVKIGITDFATGALGDIVFVELPAVGSALKSMATFGSVEAVKTVSDLFSPVTGEVAEVNPAVQTDPGVVNRSPYDEGWMIRARDRESRRAGGPAHAQGVRGVGRRAGRGALDALHGPQPGRGEGASGRDRRPRFEDLIQGLPESLRLKEPVAIPPGQSEMELRRFSPRRSGRTTTPCGPHRSSAAGCTITTSPRSSAT